MANILVAGLATVDFLFHVDEMPQRAEKYRAQDAAIVGGGGAANAAVSIARLGGAASLVARIGDDQIGEIILADLEAEGVETSLVQRCPGGRSAYSSVLVDAKGERQVVNFRGAALDETPDLSDAPAFDALLVDTRFPELTQAGLSLAKKHGIPGVVDGEHPVDLNSLADASHIAFSAQGLVGLTGIKDLGEALRAVARQVSAWVCVTDGANGVFYLRDGAMIAIKPVQIEAVDTLAAGDVWHGAFALRLAEGADETAAITFANAAATLKCQRPGGRTGCPDRQTTEQFMIEHTRRS